MQKQNSLERNTIATKVVAIALAFAFIRICLPFHIPFIPIVFPVIFIWVLSTNKFKITFDLITLFYVTAIIFFIFLGELLSGHIKIMPLKDVSYGISIYMFFLVLKKVFSDNQLSCLFKDYFFRWLFLLTFIISLVSLYKYFDFSLGIEWSSIKAVSPIAYPWGTSLVPDYNMQAMVFLIGLISGSYLLDRVEQNKLKCCLILMSVVIFVAAFFLGSRRFYVAIILIVAIYFSSLFKNLFVKGTISKTDLSYLFFFMITGVIVFFAFYLGYLRVEEIIVRIKTLFNFSDSLYQSRGVLLEYAISNKFSDINLVNFMFGSGFDYMDEFGDLSCHMNNIKICPSSYPHNPLFSAMLYGGFFNLLLYVTLFIHAGYLWIKNLSREFYLFIIFVIVMVFCFISLNTIFSIPISFLWLMLPFCFHQDKLT